MDSAEKSEIIGKFKVWFRDKLIVNHKRNTEKLVDINQFNINPFLLYYLANYLEGNAMPESLAKVLVYPRVLGTSITTSFGQNVQSFVTEVLDGYGSSTSGIDIEFIDHLDGERKYCQLKSGPSALNNDDVETIKGHFKGVLHLSRTNNLRIPHENLVFALTYGEKEDANSFIKKLEKDHVVLYAKDFWHRFTGDELFYYELISAAGEVANEVDMKSVVEDVISKLSLSVEDKFKELYNKNDD
jgi:hypothetical protein